MIYKIKTPKVTKAAIQKQPLKTGNTQRDIIEYGAGNSLPFIISQSVKRSVTASRCVSIISEYTYSNGFVGGDIKVNDDKTLNDILREASKQLALFDGFALLIKYNAKGQILTDCY